MTPLPLRHPARAAAAVVVVVAGIALRLVHLATPDLDSDMAVYGLMARKVLDGELAVFQWGLHYMGSIESIVGAPLMVALGPNAFAISLVAALFSMLFAFAIHRLVAESAGPEAGGWALAFACLPPLYLLKTSIVPRGGYVEILALGTLAFVFAVRATREEDPRRPLAATGAFLGVAFWTHPLAVLYGAAILLFWVVRKPLLVPRSVAWAGVPFFVGSAPFWYATFRSDFATFAVASEATMALADKVSLLVTRRLPVLLGILHDTRSAAPTVPWLGWWLALVGVAGVAGLVHRSFSPTRSTERDLSTLLLGFASIVFVAYLSSSFSASNTERYLVPLYTVLCAAPAIALGSLAGRRKTIGAAALVVAIAMHAAVGLLSATILDAEALSSYRAKMSRDRKLFERLAALGLDTAYVADYWDGPRLTFAAEERLVFATPFEDRRPEYLARASTRERIAFIAKGRWHGLEGALALAGASFERETLRVPPVSPYHLYHSIERIPRSGRPIPVKAATASERAPQASFGVDGDPATRWTSGTAQRPGMWYEIELADEAIVDEVAFLPGLWLDRPRGLRVEASLDRTRWIEVAEAAAYWGPLSWKGGRPVPERNGWVTARFEPTPARWIRLALTAGDDLYSWGIAEVAVCRPG